MEYYFAGLKVDAARDLPSFRAFTSPRPYSHRISLAFVDEEAGAQGPVRWESHHIVCQALPDGWRFSSADPTAPVVLWARERYTQLAAYLPPGPQARAQMWLRYLIRTAMECAFSFEGIASLHAACVLTRDQAVAFTAPSGTGKSVRAQQWVKSLDAHCISGDRPAIRLVEDGAVAYGVPWDGKEQIYVQEEAPLRAILEVRRAGLARLRRLTRAQARRLLMQQCFVPMWDPMAAAATLGTIERLVAKVPVYRLFGGMDRDAAVYAHRALFDAQESDMEETGTDMRIKDNFVLRNVVDEYIVMPVGKNIETFEGVLVLNDVSAFLWENLQKPVSRKDLLALLLAEFDVDEQTAARDMDIFLDKLRQNALLVDE